MAGCKKHPRSPIGAGEHNRGQCYECLGRPPGWWCTQCEKSLPCEHITLTPALSKELAKATALLYRTLDLYKDGGCGWAAVERAVKDHETALWHAWCEWMKLERRN